MAAIILPFPSRAPEMARAVYHLPEADPRERLAHALSSLQSSLAAQRDAVAVWRRSLEELHGAAASLHTGLVHYRQNLHAIGGKLPAAPAAI